MLRVGSSCLMRDRTQAPLHWEFRVSATGPPQMSQTGADFWGRSADWPVPKPLRGCNEAASGLTPQKAADCCQGEGWLHFSGGTESRQGEPGPFLVLGSPSVASTEESTWGERSRGRCSPAPLQTAEGWFRDRGKRIPDAHTLFDFFKHWSHTSVSSLLSCWSVCLFELQFLLAQGVLFPCVFYDLSIYLGEFFEAWCCHHLSPLAGHSKVQCVGHWQFPSSVSLKGIAVAWALAGQQEERSQSQAGSLGAPSPWGRPHFQHHQLGLYSPSAEGPGSISGQGTH